MVTLSPGGVPPVRWEADLGSVPTMHRGLHAVGVNLRCGLHGGPMHHRNHLAYTPLATLPVPPAAASSGSSSRGP